MYANTTIKHITIANVPIQLQNKGSYKLMLIDINFETINPGTAVLIPLPNYLSSKSPGILTCNEKHRNIVMATLLAGPEASFTYQKNASPIDYYPCTIDIIRDSSTIGGQLLSSLNVENIGL